MLKRILPFFMIGFLSILMGNSNTISDGVLLKDFPESSILKNVLDNRVKEEFRNVILLPFNDFDQMEAAAIINRLNKLPSNLIKKVESNGIKVKLFNGKLTDNPSAKKLTGIIPRGYETNKTWDSVPGIGGSSTVLVKIGASKKGSGHGSVNLELHELAHSIDNKVLKYASRTDSFKEIWDKEKEYVFPLRPYFQSYVEEYFAEVFAMYYFSEETKTELQMLAPLTYQYIKSIN